MYVGVKYIYVYMYMWEQQFSFLVGFFLLLSQNLDQKWRSENLRFSWNIFYLEISFETLRNRKLIGICFGWLDSFPSALNTGSSFILNQQGREHCWILIQTEPSSPHPHPEQFILDPHPNRALIPSSSPWTVYTRPSSKQSPHPLILNNIE